MALDDFYTRLGTVFIPATVQMQIQAGLDTYIPAVPAGMSGKPDTVPDETAILFWDSQQTYTDAFNMLAVRTYTLTHASVYGPGSGAAFPTLFTGSLAADQPCYLVDHPADWMHGQLTQWLVGRPAAQTPADFAAGLSSVLSTLQSSGDLEGAVACAGSDYFVFWGLGEAGGAAVQQLSAVTADGWAATLTPEPTTLTAGLWEPWPGLTVTAGDCLNLQFARRWEG